MQRRPSGVEPAFRHGSDSCRYIMGALVCRIVKKRFKSIVANILDRHSGTDGLDRPGEVTAPYSRRGY